MSPSAPYRESDVVDLVERACPKCGARVPYAVGDTSAFCAACDMQFAIAIASLTKGEPRQRAPDGEPAPLPMEPTALVAVRTTGSGARAQEREEVRKLLVVIGTFVILFAAAVVGLVQ